MKATIWISVLLAALLSTPHARAAETVEEFDVTSGGLLELDLGTGGSITVTGWDRESVRVEAHGPGNETATPLDIRRTDRGVAVEIKPSGEGTWGWRERKGYDVEIQVPARFDIEVESMGGGITIKGVEGNIEGETMGGALVLSNLRGRLDMSTMGGPITLTDSDVDGQVSTMGGKVLLENVTGDVDGSSMGGNVIYKNVRRSDGSSSGSAIVITTMGGEIELAEAPHGARLETMGGRIEVGSAAEFVDAETMGGDVILHEVDGRVSATTMGGDVEVRVIGDPQADDRSIEISSMGGEIRLTVPRNFSMDVEIELAYTKRRAGRYSIHSDLDLAITEESGWDYDHGDARRVIRGRGTFAGGKNKVEISTVNGDVILKQGG